MRGVLWGSCFGSTAVVAIRTVNAFESSARYSGALTKRYRNLRATQRAPAAAVSGRTIMNSSRPVRANQSPLRMEPAQRSTKVRSSSSRAETADSASARPSMEQVSTAKAWP